MSTELETTLRRVISILSDTHLFKTISFARSCIVGIMSAFMIATSAHAEVPTPISVIGVPYCRFSRYDSLSGTNLRTFGNCVAGGTMDISINGHEIDELEHLAFGGDSGHYRGVLKQLVTWPNEIGADLEHISKCGSAEQVECHLAKAANWVPPYVEMAIKAKEIWVVSPDPKKSFLSNFVSLFDKTLYIVPLDAEFLVIIADFRIDEFSVQARPPVRRYSIALVRECLALRLRLKPLSNFQMWARSPSLCNAPSVPMARKPNHFPYPAANAAPPAPRVRIGSCLCRAVTFTVEAPAAARRRPLHHLPQDLRLYFASIGVKKSAVIIHGAKTSCGSGPPPTTGAALRYLRGAPGTSPP